MKVAIWGSYNHGNYGDDVMAIMFVKRLQKLGVSPWVYRLDEKLAKLYKVNTTNSLTELFQGTKFCILGGGTVLLEPLSGSVGSAMNEDTRQLLKISEQEKCPLFCISIGGDGTTVTNRKLTLYQWDLLKSEVFQGGTVRLQQDAELFGQLNKEVCLFPDVVLSLANIWNLEPKSSITGKLQVGFCLPDRSDTRKFANLLGRTAFFRRHAVFHFIHTRLPGYNIKKLALLPATKMHWIKHHHYEDPAKTIEFIASLDVLISNKLHPCITAIASGVPIYSVDKRAKTLAVFKSIGLEFVNHSLSQNFLNQLASQLASRKKILEIRNQFNFQEIEEYKNLSRGHLDYLTNLVDQFR